MRPQVYGGRHLLMLAYLQHAANMDPEKDTDPEGSARFFAEKLRAAGYGLDFSLKSLSSEIDKLFETPLFSDHSSPAQWHDEAGLEAYVGETLRQLFNGEWKGAFSQSNPGANFYLSWVQFGEFRYFPSHFLAYRIGNGEADTGTFNRYLDRLLPAIKLREADD
jgi:hypothetical protein